MELLFHQINPKGKEEDWWWTYSRCWFSWPRSWHFQVLAVLNWKLTFTVCILKANVLSYLWPWGWFDWRCRGLFLCSPRPCNHDRNWFFPEAWFPPDAWHHCYWRRLELNFDWIWCIFCFVLWQLNINKKFWIILVWFFLHFLPIVGPALDILMSVCLSVHPCMHVQLTKLFNIFGSGWDIFLKFTENIYVVFVS